MRCERWSEIERLFLLALEQEPAARHRWLAAYCRDDPELVAEVAALLAADAEVAAVSGEGERIVSEVGERVVVGSAGRYRLEERLGVGGTSSVYVAVREVIGAEPVPPDGSDRVAVKVLRGDGNPSLAARFATEVRVLRQLDHPGIARFVDSGVTGRGQPFVVTAYVEGQPIDRYCARRSLPLRPRLELFVAVCEAVHEAHRHLIIHRDLKPGNVLVDGEGRPVLLDFGLARLLEATRGSGAGAAPTETAGRMLTLYSASPEQIRGEPLTTATDVWGLGVLLYCLIAGRAPFLPWHDRPELLVHAICHRDPPLPSRAAAEGSSFPDRPERWARQLSGDLDAVTAMALRKRPAYRYASVEQLAEDVRRHLDGRPVRARRASVLYRVGKALHRHRLAWATAAALALGLLLASVTALIQERRMARERDRTERSFELLVDLLGTADPSRAGGDTVTAREILDRGSQRIEEELGDQPDLAARMRDAVGSLYLALGAFEEAEASLTVAVALRRELARDRPSLELAESLENLGVLRQEQGRNAEAEALFRDALDQRTEILGPRALPVAFSLAHLADAVRDQAEYDEAEALYERALALLRSHVGEEHEKVAEMLNSYGMLRHDRSDTRGAEALYRRALEIQRRRFTGDHPAISSSLQNLASVLRQQRRFDEAAELFEQAVAMSERLYGPDSSDVGVTLQNLGLLHLNRGDFAAATAAFERAIDIDRRTLGDDHSNVATNVYHLGLVALRAGDRAAAETRFRDAIERYERSLGAEHPWVAFPLLGLGTALVEDCRPAEAVSLLERATTIRTEALGADHWRVAEVESMQSRCLAYLGDRTRAAALLRRALGVLNAHLPPEHPTRLEAAEWLRRIESAEVPPCPG